jgi:hypothetical protein
VAGGLGADGVTPGGQGRWSQWREAELSARRWILTGGDKPMRSGGGGGGVTGWRQRRDGQHWLEPGGGGATGSGARAWPCGRLAVEGLGFGGCQAGPQWVTGLDAETREVQKKQNRYFGYFGYHMILL